LGWGDFRLLRAMSAQVKEPMQKISSKYLFLFAFSGLPSLAIEADFG
jgi:hypothetical protein